MSTVVEAYKYTALYSEHCSLHAKMAPFAGWMMPIQYSGILAEHQWTRTQCSLFDVSHMGEFIIRGDAERTGLDYAVTVPVRKLDNGQCRYGFLLNESGGIIDDIIVYALAPQEWMVVVNAATIETDERFLRRQLRLPASLDNISGQVSKLDLQGPLSGQVMQDVLGINVNGLSYYQGAFFEIDGRSVFISRTGYTGELGFELYLSNEQATEIWRQLLADVRVKPAGLGCRDTLRLEMGFPLYGQDIDEQSTPLEAGLDKFIDWEKSFFGKAALEQQQGDGILRKLVALRTASRRAPRHDFLITSADKEIGRVTSGTFSPSLGCGIALGYVDAEYAQKQIPVNCRDAAAVSGVDATICAKPFYTDGSARKKI